MISKKAQVTNRYGIHCRPASVIAQEAQKHDCTITITKEDCTGHANSVLELVSLSIACGETVTIEVEGTDEEEACDRMVELFEKDFDFKR